MTRRRVLLVTGWLGLLLWICSAFVPWFSVDSTLQLPNLYGHGPTSFTSHVQETLWLWDLGYRWPFGVLSAGWLLGLLTTIRGFRSGVVLMFGTLCGTLAFIGFQWKLEGMWIARDLHVGAFVAVLGGTLSGVSGAALAFTSTPQIAGDA